MRKRRGSTAEELAAWRRVDAAYHNRWRIRKPLRINETELRWAEERLLAAKADYAEARKAAKG